MQLLRSFIFTACFLVWTLLYAMFFVVACLMLPIHARFALARVYARAVLGGLRLLCGLGYEVRGAANFPDTAYVTLWKHASAWETIAQFVIGRPQALVLKRELMWIPFFGWGLAQLRMIPINRSSGASAVNLVISAGEQRLREGLSVLVFPEGTRVPAGETRKYGVSGALLASRTGAVVVPVAHDAGYYWARRGLLKRPGVITVSVGPPIAAAGRDAREINAEAQAWIEAEIARIRARKDSLLKSKEDASQSVQP
jgi:1-acyl-sn-glycerol-3-phosphate acyltransferase